MCKVYYPKDDLKSIAEFPHKTIFLAGSIEMGKAEKWQDKMIQMAENDDLIFFNPRRNDWDNSWNTNRYKGNMKQQIDWELYGLQRADVIVMYFDKNTISPITLLELGLHAASRKVILCCPKDYHRKANVDAIAAHYQLESVDTLEELYLAAKTAIQ